MPITYQLEPDTLRFNAVGDVEFDDGLRMLRRGLEEYVADRKANHRVVFDIRRSTENRSTVELRQIVQITQDYLGPDSQVAFLVATRDVMYGLSRMCTAYFDSEFVTAEVFLNEEAVDEWFEGGDREDTETPDLFESNPLSI